MEYQVRTFEGKDVDLERYLNEQHAAGVYFKGIAHAERKGWDGVYKYSLIMKIT